MRTFYNPKKCAMSISMAYSRQAGILEFAPSLNPNHRGQVQKGQKLFDWSNKLVFMIAPEEAPCLMRYIKGQINKEFLSLTHSPTGNTKEKMSSLTLSGKFPYINVTCSITHQGQKRSATYTLRCTDTLDEISVFQKFLEKIIEAPFIDDYLYHAMNYAQKQRNKQS